MRWRKLGRLFCPDGSVAWMRTHASNPVAEPLDSERVRVHFSARDDAGRSSIGSVLVSLHGSPRVLTVSEAPSVPPGAPGLFDDSGVSASCLVSTPQGRFLYYTGWNLAVTVPWRNSIGLAISPAGCAAFDKVSRAPIVDRSEVDPYSLSYPWVLPDGGRWRMWYGSNLAWGREQREMRHVLKYAESDDGIVWRRDGTIAIPLEGEEWGVSKPCVVRDGPLLRMWFSSRSDAGYGIRYAESEDGLRWTRRDDLVGIRTSDSGWDAEMIEYPCVFDCGGERYMLYNGNGFGRTGFGIAVLEG